MVESRNNFSVITNSVNYFKTLKARCIFFNAGFNEQVFSPKP